MGTESYFTGLNQTEHEADHSPTSGAEIKKEWNYTSTPT
jgi:hypothetical protein